MNLRILHVINSIDLAGAELVVSQLALMQSKLGHTIGVYCVGDGDSDLVGKLRSEGITVEIAKGSLINIVFDAFKLLRFIKKFRPHVVNSHLFASQLLVSIVSVFISRSSLFVTTEHSTSNRRRGKLFGRFVDWLVYRKYDAIVCVSDSVKISLSNWQPSMKRLFVINNGIDFDAVLRAEAVDVVLETGLRKPIIACVGRLDFVKRQDILIEVMTYLDGFSLLLIGDGSRKSFLQGLAKQTHVDDRVFFYGKTSRVFQLVKGCDIYVQPSEWEGFGLAALEAVACGLKAVVSDVAGLRDVIQDVSEHSIIVRSRDPKDWARAIRLAYENRSDSGVVKNNRLKYSVEEMGRRYADLYLSELSVKNERMLRGADDMEEN